jgi:hypothetical protein
VAVAVASEPRRARWDLLARPESRIKLGSSYEAEKLTTRLLLRDGDVQLRLVYMEQA